MERRKTGQCHTPNPKKGQAQHTAAERFFYLESPKELRCEKHPRGPVVPTGAPGFSDRNEAVSSRFRSGRSHRAPPDIIPPYPPIMPGASRFFPDSLSASR